MKVIYNNGFKANLVRIALLEEKSPGWEEFVALEQLSGLRDDQTAAVGGSIQPEDILLPSTTGEIY